MRIGKPELVFAAVVACGLALYGCEPSPLQVFPASCAVLHNGADGIGCDLAPDRHLSLLVVAPAVARVTCTSNGGTVNIIRQRANGDERLLEVEVPPKATRLEIRSSEGLHLSQAVSVTVRDKTVHEAPWLTAALQSWENSLPDKAEAQLRPHLNDPATEPEAVESRIQALGLLGAIAADRNGDEALPLFEQAIAESHKAHLASFEALYSLRKSWLLANHRHRYDQAEKFLLEQTPVFNQVPGLGSWRLLQQAHFRQALGNLSGALVAYEKAEESAKLFGDEDARTELAMARATNLVMMGRLTEVKELLGKIVASPSDPCRRGMQLATQGWLQNLARQTLRQADPRWQDFDPHPALEKSVALLRQCKQPVALANAMTNLAHVAALDDSAQGIAQWLGQAKKELPSPESNLAMEWAELEGKYALLAEDWSAATAHYQRLAALGRKQDMYESVWVALIGEARAAEAHDKRLAAKLYERAEKYLDERSLELPLAAGRGTFLGRFERGTAHYLDLLVSQQRYPEAVQLIRHARARGLRALVVIARANALSDPQRRSWEQMLVNYRQMRRELDELAADASQDAQTVRNAIESEEKPRILQLLQKLDETLHELGTVQADTEFRQPSAQELMLICHPTATTGWHCFVWDKEGTQHLLLKEMNEVQLNAALAAAKAKLERAQRLHVIAYGEMRQLDVHLLPGPLAKQPLDAQLDVAYALDLPLPLANRTQENKKALMIFDPQGRLPQSRRAAEPLQRQMQQANWEVVVQSAAVRRIGEYPNKPKDTRLIDSAELRTLLGQVRLFHYSGHGDFVPQGGWLHHLRTADGPGLLVGDILTLSQAPERVLLFGCNTGTSEEDSGAIEGLGLAQSFLLRGSRWVTATNRAISDQAAAEMAIEMYRNSQEPGGLAGDSPEPVALLRAARIAVLARTKDPAVRRDLASFRVFQP